MQHLWGPLAMLMMLPAIWWRSGLTKARPEVAPGCLLSLLASLYPLARGEAITEAEWAALHLQQGSESRVKGPGLRVGACSRSFLQHHRHLSEGHPQEELMSELAKARCKVSALHAASCDADKTSTSSIFACQELQAAGCWRLQTVAFRPLTSAHSCRALGNCPGLLSTPRIAPQHGSAQL